MGPVAIGLAIQAVGGLANFFANQSAEQKAKTLADENFQRWANLAIPDPEKQKITFQRLISQGTVDPRLEESIHQTASELSKIGPDTKNLSAQQRALASLEREGYEGGLSLRDEANLNEAMQASNVKARGSQDAILQNEAQRGTQGSGFGIAAQIANGQAEANRNANASLSTAASASERALKAIQGAGDLATSYNTQNFNQAAQKATAQDAINRFNTSNLQDVQQRNVGSLNAAQAANLAAAQSLSDRNAGISNAEQIRNKDLYQQQFENQAKVLQGQQGASDKQAASDRAQGQNAGNAITGLANMGANVAYTYGSDQQRKEEHDRDLKDQFSYFDNYWKAKKNNGM